MGFGVDRYRDASGTPTTGGAVISLFASMDTCQLNNLTNATSTTNGFFEMVPSDNGTLGGPHGSNRIPFAAPNHTGTWNGGVAPIVPWDGGPLNSPISCVIGSATEYGTAGTTATASLYGTTRTYRACGLVPDSGSTGRVLMLWE
jgi:hypothetical protein